MIGATVASNYCRSPGAAATVGRMAAPRSIAIRDVTDAEVSTFLADGFVVLPGLLDPAAVLAMAAPVDRALGAPETADVGAFAGLGDQPAFRAGVDHWRADPDFAAFSLDPSLGGLAARLLDSAGIHLYEDSILVKEPGAPFRTEFHTDAAYFHISGEQAATFWIPLDDVDAANGALQYVRGSHRWDREFRPNLFTIADPIPGTEGEQVPDVLGDDALRDLVVGCELAPGDVAVHHYRTMHGSPANTHASRRRRAISLRYCGDDVRYRFRAGMPVRRTQRDHVDGDRLDPLDCPAVWPAT